MWKRPVLKGDAAEKVGAALQPLLADLIDLALTCKQAHWAVYGKDFLSVHEKLDEVIETARTSSDEVAERMVQLGVVPDGSVATVAAQTDLAKYPIEFVDVSGTVTAVCDMLSKVAQRLRAARAATEDPDPLTEDLVIGIGKAIEEHLWMFQAMEGDDPN